MPFANEFDSVFTTIQRAIAHAVPGEEISCYWLKDEHAAGKITDDIVHLVQVSDFCIADVTGCNPNVMWETGYAMALDKPTILIGQRIAELPFDLKIHRVLPYAPESLLDLEQRLKEAVVQTIARYKIEPKYQFTGVSKGVSSTIVVTGTAHAESIRVNRRIEILLQPYLGSHAIWYCGSTGTVDESTLEFLLKKKELVIPVAYHQYDFSPGVRQMIEAGKVRYIDASMEPLPKGFTGPSGRDVFFCSKADLIILLWDGESRGTKKLIDYFEQKGKNMLIGFI